MKIKSEKVEGKIILRLEGRLDTSSAPILEREINQLMKSGEIHILVDFSGVDYLSSAGMRVLHSSMKKAKSQKGHFIIFGLNDEPEKIIQLAGFHKILHICSSERDALQIQ